MVCSIIVVGDILNSVKKEKLDNFWYYYKWHTIAALFAIAIIGIGVNDAVRARSIELFAAYYGDTELSEEEISTATAILSESGIDPKKISFEYSHFSLNDTSNENLVLGQKIVLSMSVGKPALFILSKDIYDEYKSQDIFEDITALTGGDFENISVPAKYTKLAALLGEGDEEKNVVVIRNIGQPKGKDIRRLENARKVLASIIK